MQRNLEPDLLVVGCRDGCDRTNLVKGEPAFAECSGNARKCGESVACANQLTTRPQSNTDVDREPVCARAHAEFGPAAVGIELCGKRHQFGGGCMNLRGETFDSVTKVRGVRRMHARYCIERMFVEGGQNTDKGKSDAQSQTRVPVNAHRAAATARTLR